VVAGGDDPSSQVVRKTPFGVVVLLVLASGCYSFYPNHVPKLNEALLVEGEQIRIETRRVKRYMECSDQDYKYDRCEIIHAKLKRPYTVYIAKAVYNGNTLTRAEFNQLVYADYPDRLKKVHDLKGVCKISMVPSVLAVGVIAVAYLGPLMTGNRFDDDQKKMIYIGGAITGAGLGILSYPLGGFACVKARSIAGDMFVSAKETEWESSDPERFKDVEKLAADFNQRRGGGTAPPADGTEPEPAPADEGTESSTTSSND
jgi:hypothetical protein